MEKQYPSTYKYLTASSDKAILEEEKVEERILLSGLKVFNRYPYAQATMKLIANEAGITDAGIFYHYKTKEELYQAVFERICQFHQNQVNKRAAILHTKKKISVKEAEKVLADIIDITADHLLGNSECYGILQILFFEYFHPTNFFDLHYERFLKPHYAMLVKLIICITKNPDEKNATFQAISIFGLLMSFSLERHTLRRLIGITGYSKEDILEIKQHVTKNALAMLRNAEN